MIILTAILGAALCIALRGWFARYVANAALLWYIQEKGIPLPSDDDMRAGAKFVTENFVKDLFQGRR